MRCPSCDHDLPEPKPKVVVQKERCACGLTENVRGARLLLVGAITIILALLAGCWITHHYNARLAGTGWRHDIHGTLQKVEDAPGRSK